MNTLPLESIGLVCYLIAMAAIFASALVADKHKGRRFSAVGLWLLVLLFMLVLGGFLTRLFTRIPDPVMFP